MAVKFDELSPQSNTGCRDAKSCPYRCLANTPLTGHDQDARCSKEVSGIQKIGSIHWPE